MKTILATLLLMLAVASCNAQNNNMNDKVQCGGYRSNNQDTEPIKNVKGPGCHLYVSDNSDPC